MALERCAGAATDADEAWEPGLDESEAGRGGALPPRPLCWRFLDTPSSKTLSSSEEESVCTDGRGTVGELMRRDGMYKNHVLICTAIMISLQEKVTHSLCVQIQRAAGRNYTIIN